MISRGRLKFLRSLQQKKVRSEERCFLVEGLNLVEEAVAAGHARELFFGSGTESSPRAETLRASGLPMSDLEQKDVSALAETRSPAGVFALAGVPWEGFDPATLPAQCIVLLAGGVADPGNFGTLIRTAAALGAAAVAVAPGTVEPTNPKVVRATAGALFRVPVFETTPGELGALGFALFVADTSGDPVETFVSRPARVALAVGNEPRGVDASLQKRADRTIGVEISGGVESLNVAVAAGILLDALRRLPVA